MKRKLTLLTVCIALICFAAIGYGKDTKPDPFAAIWEEINNIKTQITNLWSETGNLQTQIDNIELIPGPQGPAGPQGPQGPPGLPSWDEARIQAIETNIANLTAKVDLLTTKIQNIKCLPDSTDSCITELPGICSEGMRTCNQDLTWGDCLSNKEPTTEVCNGLDDDCNGLTDETCECAPGSTESCITGLPGTCSEGVKTCGQDYFWGECIARYKLDIEICPNGIDDNCNGAIDECDYYKQIVRDFFDNYSYERSIIGQSSWISHVNGENFIVQSAINHDAGALANHFSGDSIITRRGVPRSDGLQRFYVRTENRDSWGPDSFVQVRFSKGPWGEGSPNLSFAAIIFEQNGNIGYSVGGGVREYFATYSDNTWVYIDLEWRNKLAHYRINDGSWTDWDPFWNSEYFTDFDNVGVEFYLTGSGGVYIDTFN